MSQIELFFKQQQEDRLKYGSFRVTPSQMARFNQPFSRRQGNGRVISWAMIAVVVFLLAHGYVGANP